MKIHKNLISLIILTVLSFIFIIQPSAEAHSVYEDTNTVRNIEIYSTSLNHLQTVELTGRPYGSFISVVYDANNHKLIVGEENEDKIYVFNWDTATRTLNETPTEVTLTNITDGVGGMTIYHDIFNGNMVIDANKLYVSDFPTNSKYLLDIT